MGGKRRSGRNGLAAALFLTLAAIYLCAGTAKGGTDLSIQELEGYYQDKERALVEDVKTFLNEEGFVHSGVMLTRVVDADGSREYTLTVHHGKIDRMKEESRKALQERLEGMIFEDPDSIFRHEFLIIQ